MMMVLGGGASGVTYLLRDEFTTDDAAPLTSPRTCEPGPGTLVVTDAANKLSISSGVVVKTGGTFKLLSGDAFTRANGVSFYSRNKITISTGEGVLASSEGGTNPTDGVYFRPGLLYGYNDGTAFYNLGTLNSIISANHDLLVVQRSAGAYLFIRGGPFGKWELLYPAITSNGETAKWMYKNVSATDTGQNDDAIVTKIGGAFASDYGYASYYSASPTSPATCTASPDSVVEFTWTPAADEVLEIYLRQVDATNRSILRCNQATSKLYLYRVTGGTETAVIDRAQTWTADTPYRIVVACHMNYYGVFLNDVFLQSGASYVNELGTGYGVSGFATGANFAIYNALTSSIPAPFDFSGWRWYYAYGDSKTATGAMSAYLSDLLETATGVRWAFNMRGRSGYTVADMAAKVASDIGLITSSAEAPESILINLGTNDVASLPAEATWKANYTTIISAMHTKWPSAKIYLAKPVRLEAAPPSTPLAACSTAHGYIDDLAALYDYVYVGMDETDLEGGDSYVTYFADALHPNTAGYAQSAALWKVALGL